MPLSKWAWGPSGWPLWLATFILVLILISIGAIQEIQPLLIVGLVLLGAFAVAAVIRVFAISYGVHKASSNTTCKAILATLGALMP